MEIKQISLSGIIGAIMSDKLKEKALEVANAIRSVNRSRHHKIMIDADDEPCYWQREEWIDWMLDLATELELEANAL